METQTTYSVILNKVDAQVKDLQVPDIEIKLRDKHVALSDLTNCPNAELETLLSYYGGYKSYVEGQLAYAESRRGVIESTFEEGLAKALFEVQQKYEKKPIKEALRGECLQTYPELKVARMELIEVEALCSRLRGMREAYKSAFDTVSRIVALRTASREQI